MQRHTHLRPGLVALIPYYWQNLSWNVSHFKPLPKSAELPKFKGGREDILWEEMDVNDEPIVQEKRKKHVMRKIYPTRKRRPASECQKY